jgi:hypothetical protein
LAGSRTATGGLFFRACNSEKAQRLDAQLVGVTSPFDK